MPPESTPDQLTFGPTFGSAFLDQHAGRIISDARFAVVELVANAWDAGADNVWIEWPSAVKERVSFADDGSGMTPEEFLHRWNELSYSRLEHQGSDVEFPPSRAGRRRRAFGRNGMGRHAMFHFANVYLVETAKAGVLSQYEVRRSFGSAPYTVHALGSAPSTRHGTTLTAVAEGPLMAPEDVIELIGSRFAADPQFNVNVNGQQVTALDIAHLTVLHELQVSSIGDFRIRRIDGQQTGRTSRHSGVAWWVNNRLVGIPSWEVSDGQLIDGRSRTGRRYLYIVEADPLSEYVAPDWSDFLPYSEVTKAEDAVAEFIREDLKDLTADVRRERKVEVLRANLQQIRRLPPASREHIARFADELQSHAPTITEKDLGNAVRLVARLEASRTGYALLEKLSRLKPGDIDRLDEILAEWSVEDAQEVLSELHFRLRLIRELEDLVEKKTTDELHDLQPLFERGLWIFGPAFESIEFTSNKTLATVVKNMLGNAVLTKPRFRPDFVVLPDSSIGVYSADSYDNDGEVQGLDRIIIVELKRGGSHITHEEKDQALGYARELRKAGRVDRATRITAYVLGSTVDSTAEEEFLEGNSRIVARRFSDVLRQAHGRTFHLLDRMQGIAAPPRDPELAEALGGRQTDIEL